VGAELIHADERTDVQTDMTKLIVIFAIFERAQKRGEGGELNEN